MIIVKLMGGLGNQMFQYALGKALAYHLKQEVKYDLSWFAQIPTGDTQREYELLDFTLDVPKASKKEIDRICGWQRYFPLYIQHVLSFLKAPSIWKERFFHFDPDIFSVPASIYIEGYWQSYRYFDICEDIIRKDFTIKIPMHSASESITQMILDKQSVSIHLRRGDYVTNPQTQKFHGSLGLDYYMNAVKIVAQRVQNPHFFIFSDDIDWAQEHFFINYPMTYIVTHHQKKAWEDMRLMSLCKHHIIANSTFSWWGAWLGYTDTQCVIAPKQWFQDKHIITDDLILNQWIRI